MFGISRETYYKIHNPKSKVPPVGYYRSSYQAVDRNTSAAAYGLQSIWNNGLAENSIKIKDRDFDEKTNVC